MVTLIVSKVEKGFEAELKQMVDEHKIAPITFIDLLVDILSMNAFLFVVSPILTTVSPLAREHWDAFLVLRRRENIELIMRRLSINQNTDIQ
jgi:hypothetical protein